MEFFNSWRQERREEKNEENFLRDFHPNFSIVRGAWRFNRLYSLEDGSITLKTRFAFDDASQLHSCDLQAKVGINFDRAIPHKFVGFVYGNSSQREELEAYGRQYPWAELIEGLNREGGSLPESVRTPLTHD